MAVDAAKTPSAKLKLPFGVDAHDDTVLVILPPPPRGMRLVTAVAAAAWFEPNRFS